MYFEFMTGNSRLRIFTPHHELPFAGHTTIGSAFAALKHGIKLQNITYLVQKCDSGIIQSIIKIVIYGQIYWEN